MNTIINGRLVRLNLKTGEIWGIDGRTKKWVVKTLYKDGGYLRMSFGGKLYQHHRVIYKIWNPNWDIENGCSTDNSIDHINGNTTDNHIQNLRNVTNQQNQCNRTKAKGCSWHKTKKKWMAYIRLNGKTIYLGLFDLEADARNAYLEAKKIYHVI